MHSYTPVVPSKPDQNGQILYPFSVDQKGAKTLPVGVVHTYMAYIREYPPPGFKSLSIAPALGIVPAISRFAVKHPTD